MHKNLIKYTLCFSLVLLVLSFSLKAQESGAPVTLRFEPKLAGETYRFSMQSTGESYYLSNIWLKGDILLETGRKVYDKSLKYNIYTDDLVWFSTKRNMQVKVDKELVKEFTINLPGEESPSVFKKLPIYESLSSRPRSTFLQELYSGEVSLMVHRRVAISGERITRSGGSLRSIANLRQMPVYYVIKPNNKIVEISRLSRWSLYRIFSGHKDEIRSAFLSERITIRSEEDLKRAISVIDKTIYAD